jgi:ABC-type Zn uptake system ZnuABC Zn-binding protein ZnuA
MKRLLSLSFITLIMGFSLTAHALQAAETLNVCATVPELGAIARTVGGEQVTVTVFARGTEDPHYLDARPSFIKALSQADLFLQVGLDLEVGWVPPLLSGARNRRVLPGGPGFLDASTVIRPLEVAAGPVDRSQGDVHPQGNPHYLTDPLNALAVADLVRDRLAALRPAQTAYFDGRLAEFRRRLGEALVGAELAGKYDAEKLALLHRHGKLEDFLRQQGDLGRLGGWLARLAPHRGAAILTYHSSWPYFAERFGLEIVGHLEPKPGIPPSPKHLLEVIRLTKERQVRLILMEPWLSRQPADLVAGRAGIPVIQAAVSASQGPDYDYLAAVGAVVEQIARALDKKSTVPSP